MLQKAQVNLDEIVLNIPIFKLMSVDYEVRSFNFCSSRISHRLSLIPDVAEILIPSSRITIEVTFPFAAPLTAIFYSETGFSKIKIIDCVRNAYKRAYRAASHVPFSSVGYVDSRSNKTYYVTYPFGSLICERVTYSKSNLIIRPHVDSLPNLSEEPQIPF